MCLCWLCSVFLSVFRCLHLSDSVVSCPCACLLVICTICTWARTPGTEHASALVCTSGPPSCGTAAQSLSGISSPWKRSSLTTSRLLCPPALSRTRSSTHSRILLSFGFRSRCSHTFVLFDVRIAFQSHPRSKFGLNPQTTNLKCRVTFFKRLLDLGPPRSGPRLG